VNCPCCKAPGAESFINIRAREVDAACAACGYDSRNHRFETWTIPAKLPRPARMSAEEFAFRAKLYHLWATRPASELVAELAYFADWLADHGRPEEAAARADWRVYGSPRNADPTRWWQWSVAIAEGWVSSGVRHTEKDSVTGEITQLAHRWINADKCKVGSTAHNGSWLLCWPPGLVRFTAPHYHDPSRFRVTVSANRGLTYSRNYDRTFPAGYATLFHPPGALDRTPAARDAGPTLFDDLEAA
jgi:hypothetical protein